MYKVYKRISDIREKIEEKNFSSIYDFFSNHWLAITKDNFNIALNQLNLVSNNSYCKYVYFIRKYLYKKKSWK